MLSVFPPRREGLAGEGDDLVDACCPSSVAAVAVASVDAGSGVDAREVRLWFVGIGLDCL